MRLSLRPFLIVAFLVSIVLVVSPFLSTSTPKSQKKGENLTAREEETLLLLKKTVESQDRRIKLLEGKLENLAHETSPKEGKKAPPTFTQEETAELERRRKEDESQRGKGSPFGFEDRPGWVPYYPGVNVPEKAIRMCNKCFWNTLETTTKLLDNGETYVFTGDLDDMWLRDSSAQVHPYLFLAPTNATLRRVIEGLILRQAFYIKFDPYANAFRVDTNYKFSEAQLKAGRGGYVATRNYELDSGAYCFRLLYKYWKAVPETPVIREKGVKEAARLMVEVWRREQRHDTQTKYTYIELPNNGMGTPTAYTGMTWSGFRPSDEPTTYGYLVPSNMMTVVALQYLEEIAMVVWQDRPFAEEIALLWREIDLGIHLHGIKEMPGFGRVYAFEVDGRGGFSMIDDANVPSLLSIPYLEYRYDPEVYANTRRFILSSSNPFYFTGRYASGIGSSHTKTGHPWHMAIIMQGLTAESTEERQLMLDYLLASDAGTELMHESFDANNPSTFTRSWFAWSNSLFAEFVMSLVPKEKCPAGLR